MWNEATARAAASAFDAAPAFDVEPTADVHTAPAVVARTARSTRKGSRAAAFVLSLGVMSAVLVDDPLLEHSLVLGSGAVALGEHAAAQVVPQLRQLEGRVRWLANRSR